MKKQIKIDIISIDENKIVSYRTTTSIVEKGEVIAKAHERKALQPIDDITNEPEDVQAVCKIFWTPQVIEDFRAKINPEQQES